MDDCLVYFFTGFLDSGKTSVICSWLDGENFRGRKAVVINTEEGEEEYIAENYPNADPVIINCDADAVNKELTFDIEARHKPDLVFIEWNGSVSPAEFFDKVDVPKRWALAAAIDNIPKLRGSVKAVNPSISINFLSKDNEIIRIEDHLPYDLSKSPCEISADDFGLFYTDALDNVDRYNGKRVTLIGEAEILREFRGRAFVLQRQAYTCCAADVGMMGVLCMYDVKSGFPAGQWLKVTGTVRYFEDEQNGQKVAVPCLTVENYAITSKPENEIIYFN